MCDNKNEVREGENDDDEDLTIRLELDLTSTTDTYPEFDYLELVRNKQLENKKKKKAKNKVNHNEPANQSHLSTDDSEVEALAKMYEEKYGTCTDDYAELGEGYDEEDSFIDNTDAVNDLLPNGVQTEHGGFYINWGKLSLVKEDNSSSLASEDVDKFLAQNRLNARRITSDDENDEKEGESSKAQSNNINNNNNNNNNNSSNSNNHNCSTGGLIKSRKRSGEFQAKTKKIRKTATPKIPDHLLNKKPFSGSSEFEKNINEIKKNRLKNVEADKKLDGNNVNDVNSKKEVSVKKKPITVKELLKERDGATEVIEAVATGADLLDKESSSSSESSESSSSDSESDSSEEGPTEKEKDKVPPAVITSEAVGGGGDGKQSGEPVEINAEDITANTFAHLSSDLKDLIGKIIEISKEEKNKLSNSKLNALLLRVDDRLRDLPVGEKNAILDSLAGILQMKRDSITKRTKKLLLMQEEAKMSAPLRKLKEIVTDMMPLLESNYFKEFTKAAGTRSIDPGSLPSRKFPWNDELRSYLKEIILIRKNCYYILRPRKESVSDYVKSFLEVKVKPFWPKDWMTVEILWEEGQATGQTKEKQKVVTKIFGTHNVHPTPQSSEKPSTVVPTSISISSLQRKQPSLTVTTSKKPQKVNKPPEVSAKPSILVPKKVPSGVNPTTTTTPIPIPKTNYPTSNTSSSISNSLGIRLPAVTVTSKSSVQDFIERSSPSTSVTRTGPTTTAPTTPTTTQQISPNRSSQQTISPNRNVIRNAPSPSSAASQNSIRPNFVRTSSPNSLSKAISSYNKVRNNNQSVLKTIEIHSNPNQGTKSSPNTVTISPVTESMLKDISPSPEVLNLTKNSSLFISKVSSSSEGSGSEPKPNRSNSPSVGGYPLPSGITISPTSATTSTFLNRPQKPVEKSPEVKINVSLTKQEPLNSIKEKPRESVLNMNYKRDGPLPHIPDCISVSSKVVPNEKPKYEHVRKRALQEYHQQHSPERLRLEESKKMKVKEEIEIRDDNNKMDGSNFSKMLETVIGKSSEGVRKSDSDNKINPLDRFTNLNVDAIINSGLQGKSNNNPANQLKNSSPKLREVRLPKEKPYILMKNDNGVFSPDDRSHDVVQEIGVRSDGNPPTKEQLVQLEMEKVMQNLVELSNQRQSEFDVDPSSINFSSSNQIQRQKSSIPEVFQKIFK